MALKAVVASEPAAAADGTAAKPARTGRPARAAFGAVTAGMVAGAALLAACGSKRSAPAVRDDAAVEVDDPAPTTLAPLDVGLPSAEAYRWRERGNDPFLAAEAAARAGTWDDVVRHGTAALAIDPGHLEAAWLLAMALAHLGQFEPMLEPLQRAVAGDFGRWGAAALEAPFEPFLATPAGRAWRQRVDALQADYLARISTGLLVEAGGALYALDDKAARWVRVTGLGGELLGALRPVRDLLAFVVRTEDHGAPMLAVGVVDLARGRARPPIALGTAGPATVAYSTGAPAGLWIRTTRPKPRWHHLTDDALAPLPRKVKAPRGARLEVDAGGARITAATAPTVTADWDDHGLASAIRIGSSNRVVTVPSPGLIDRATLTWSPGRSHLAFVAHLDDGCEPGVPSSFAYVADAATGRVAEVDRAVMGLALAWVRDRRLAIAGDAGVATIELGDDGGRQPVAGAHGLVVPRLHARCAAAAAPAPGPTDGPADGPVVEPPQGVRSSPAIDP